MRKFVLAALACAVVLAACGDDSEDGGEAAPSTTAGPTTTAAPTTTTEPPCSRPATAGRDDRTIAYGGVERPYILYVPAGYDGTTTDLLLDLHGSGSNSGQQFDGSEIAGVADEHGFLVVAPDAGIAQTLGSGETQVTGGVWNIPGVVLTDGSTADPNAPDDVAYIETLVGQLREELCIDDVFTTGTSGGGRMSSALACFSDEISGAAPVAGLRLPEDCRPTHGVEIVAFHGTEDKVNPYLGGGAAYWGPQTVPEAAQAWATLQECAAAPTRTQVSPSVTLDTWTGCVDDVEVRLYTVNGGGHNWPGGVDAAAANPAFAEIIGVTTQEIDAGQLMWERFAQVD
jgi:polyhydroxybutyrate depolymerase